jgi:hypothetical protein
VPSPGFEPTIPAIQRLQTCALDRTATGIHVVLFIVCRLTDPVACDFIARTYIFVSTSVRAVRHTAAQGSFSRTCRSRRITGLKRICAQR